MGLRRAQFADVHDDCSPSVRGKRLGFVKPLHPDSPRGLPALALEERHGGGFRLVQVDHQRFDAESALVEAVLWGLLVVG
jgi:hypothetical protein